MPKQQPRRGRPPEGGTAMHKIVFIRMSQADFEAFELEAKRLAELTGMAVSVPAYLRRAGRAMLGKKITP